MTRLGVFAGRAAKICVALSAALILGFWLFFLYSLELGISKQSVYTGRVGFWMGAYLLFALLASLVCVAALLWMRFVSSVSWKNPAGVFVLSWLIVIVGFWLWNGVAEVKFQIADPANGNVVR